MISFSPVQFETLKARVLANANIRSITPGDCKALALQIYSKTKLTVSETTLKRVYGFAYSKFKPSLFTIDVLAKFCGFEGWDNFCAQENVPSAKSQNEHVDWKTLSHNAAKITHFTLQALKNRSGIPFHQTIRRKFIDDHFDEFLRGDYTATVFTAPSGYGKTIGLCHWIDEKLESDTNDIILFFSSSALMNVFLSGRDLNDWLLALLGYSHEEDIEALFDINKRNGGKFYLIIDGFDEHMFKNDQFELVLTQLMDIFSFYQSHEWFKLVLTMRSANWINNKHNMEFGLKNWFTGFITDHDLTTNVPLFNIQEIKQLCRNINPLIQSFIAIDVVNNFNHPLYFQFYYKQHKNNFSLNNIDHICIYELISIFILNKVYLGHYATEKILLLKGLVDEMDFKSGVYELDKFKCNDLLKQYSHAYNELLSIGFLREVNSSNGFQFKTLVQFGNNNFLEFTVARKLLLDNNQRFDLQLIKLLNNAFSESKHKLPVIKWCVIHAIKNGQQESFELLAQTGLNPKEKSELIVFLGDLLQKICFASNNSETTANYFKQDCGDGLFYYFFGMELIHVDYKKALQVLLKFELSDHKKILTYTALATIAILQLDVKQLEDYLAKLKNFPRHDFQQFAINPLHCLNAIYQYLKYGIIRKDFFAEATRFYFNPPKQIEGVYDKKANDLTYLLAAYSTLICQKPFKTLRFVNTLNKIDKPGAETSFAYNFFLKIVASDASFVLDRKAVLTDNSNSISISYKQEEYLFTPFMKALFYSLKIKNAIINNDYSSISGYLNCLNQVSDESGNKLPKLFIYFTILNNEQLTNLDPQLYKQVSYNHTKLLRECGLSPDIFVKSKDAHPLELKVKVNN
ncbi:hypothetical protein SNE25_31345 [Mucilaginibacter sabulilitoris]|uniref:NACHT domain-containing protein n=1 Tax=Mucilaginibacter sabulilitoris TaxID=1173583 RepID=A0ABZ0TN10_9SPHI|nr:hypothetical protein [Mucilaginibacter sabulilitoris]WPU93817.1 hypothetical protein SNE25_31345 [Mucilaginibacter sabulilitoris]